MVLGIDLDSGSARRFARVFFSNIRLWCENVFWLAIRLNHRSERRHNAVNQLVRG